MCNVISQNIINKYPINIELSNLPDDISISTMTITCKIDTFFNVSNIGKYIDLKYNGIIAVKHGDCNDKTTNRSLILKRTKLQKNKKKKSFYNQVTIIIRLPDIKIKDMNVKLFSNGSIQMTGCKSIESFFSVLSYVFSELKIVKCVVDFKNQQVIEKRFVTNFDILDIDNLKNIKICMINSNFSMGFNIDRDRLQELLTKDGYESYYDAILHACVNIKYEHADKIISIFVFESGAIIITGARNCNQINDAYKFINKYLLENYFDVNKNNIMNNQTILDFVNEYSNPNDIKPKKIYKKKKQEQIIYL